MHAGVTMRLPDTIIMEDDVEIGADSVILRTHALGAHAHCRWRVIVSWHGHQGLHPGDDVWCAIRP
jgi:bifunctional N-acetylglucosamine-1-phosphate-uridyltransferase/glucosamine-1-phosphate-acetyltransferase GlmU-like protein